MAHLSEKKKKGHDTAQLKSGKGGMTMAPPKFGLEASPLQAKMAAENQPIQAKAGNAPIQRATPNLTPGEQHIYNLRTQINAAAAASNVDATLVAAILLDEYNRRGIEDGVQDLEAQFIIAYEGIFESTEVAMWEGMFGPLDDTSFGDAQMNLGVVEDMVNQGYVNQPADWNSDRLDSKLRMATDSQMAPTLVAARIRQTIDHWQAGGVDISGRPEILGTLYSMGLTGRSGVNPNPQPNARGTQIDGYRSRMGTVLSMP